MGVYIYKKGLGKFAAVMGGILARAVFLNITVWNGQGLVPATAEARKIPIYCVETAEKKVAISFDAAWGDEHTDPILDILDQYGVKTTFFLVKFWAEKFPEDVAKIYEKGHEIGSHSATHPNMTELPKEKMTEEIQSTGDTLERITGKKPTLFRPPFGAYNNSMMETAETMGYKVIQWSVDSLDWKELSAEQIVERVCRNATSGSIVLFHNNAEKVEEYLPLIIEKLQKDGYTIVPVGELVYGENFHIDNTGKQISN